MIEMIIAYNPIKSYVSAKHIILVFDMNYD